MIVQHVPWLSILICYCFCIYFCVDFTVVSGHIVEDQQQSLLKLKNNLKFTYEKSTKLVSWNPSIGCCHWRGVTCDNEGHVIGIDLSEESIYGGFDNSSSLFNLQNLQRLNLGANNFNSVIPFGFNKLKKLTYLNLSYAGFVGQIPIEISQLTRLVTLDISSLSFLYKQPLKLENLELRKLVQNLTSIRQLYMDGVNVNAQAEEWCNTLLLLPRLQEVSMSNCNLSGPLDSSLSRLESLSVIRLDGNNLSSPVPGSFANLSNLTTLHLSSCGLTGIFPEKIFQLATLSDIDISFNYALSGSLPEFPQNGLLRTLIVSDTNFSGPLPASISNLRQLSILDLSFCYFNRMLPSSISRLTQLTHLLLPFNDFTGPIPSLNMSKNLIHVDLSINHLTGSITSLHLEGLRKLVQIDFQDNFLNGSIPSSLFALPLLQSIQLSNNKFQSKLHEFSNISSSMLEILDLSSNNLEGPIPTSIFHLRSLSVLKLASNKFNGILKLDVVHRLANLTTLDLSHNHLSIDTNVTDARLSSFPKMRNVELASCNLTVFPIFLIKISKITTLDLSSNRIQGSIPAWIWQFDYLVQLNLSHNLLCNLEGPVQKTNSTLKVIDLHSNLLQGKLPIFPARVAYLDYSSNNFSFTIPSNVGTNLSSAIFLSLSNNSLSGNIPQSLCYNSNLLVLDVSYNRFEGTIPECLTQSETLVVLNLQHNVFHGTIPGTFKKSCALRTLDLNGNQLGGPIPNSLVNCTSLEVLDLGNNQITDVFPCFLKKLPTLRVIVLRKNKFHSGIECAHTNSTWHMIQIVDLAFNNFSGLFPVLCFKTWDTMILDEDHDVSKFTQLGSQVLKYSGAIYYQDSVTLTSKGLQMEFVKILRVLTSVDFSSNNFHGPIPEELMNFTQLLVLNLSHNAFTGQIPSSIGNLKQLESLDLSKNNFDGEIPKHLASLTFLSYLNLSFNHLVGKIPRGAQLQTFDATSFAGNEKLCGIPLTKMCPDQSNSKEVRTDSGVKFDWTSVSIGVGFGVGAGLVVAPLLFWEKAKKWSNRKIDKVLLVILPMIGLIYIPIDDDEAEEDTKECNSKIEEDCDFNDEQDNLSYEMSRVPFCVLCSKLDINKKKVIHDSRCTCYYSPTVSRSIYPEPYSSESHA